MISGEEVGHWTDKQTDRQTTKQLNKLTKLTSLSLLQMIDHCLAPDKTGDGSGCDNMTVVIVQFLHESTEESKSTFVSPTKGKSLGKRPAPSGSEIDSNEQVKRSRLEMKPSQ